MGNLATTKRRERRKRRSTTNEYTRTAAHGSITTSSFITIAPLTELANSIDDVQYTQILGILLSQKSKKPLPGPRTIILDRGQTPVADREEIFNFLSTHRREVNNSIYECLRNDERLLAIEGAQFDKFGPYRDAPWSAVREKLMKYYGEHRSIQVLHHPEMAFISDEIVEELTGGTDCLIPAPVEIAFEALPKATFYGYPWFTSKWAEIPGVAEETISIAKGLFDLVPEAVEKYLTSPWTIFNRVVPNGLEENKVRATMAPPKYGALFEKCFTMPILSRFQGMRWSSGYCGDHIVGPKVRYGVRNNNVVFSMDYEAFDQSCGIDARNYVRDIIKRAYGHKYDNQLDLMFKSFERPTVLTPDGIISSTAASDFGLGSGIGPTGIIGSIWNRVCAKYLGYLLKREYSIEITEHFGYGDDTVLMWQGDSLPTIDWFAAKLLDLSMHINVTKQEYTHGAGRYASFLGKQYYYIPTYGVTSPGIYSAWRMLTRLLYKDVQSDEKSRLRHEDYQGVSPLGCDMLDSVALLEEVKYHPWFKTLVEFAVLHHPMRLKTSHYLRDHARNMEPGEERKGLITFRSVQYVLRLEAEGLYSTGKEEEEWCRHVVTRYAKSIFTSKGVVVTARQALCWLKGEKVEWDGEQLAVTVATARQAEKPLAQRVEELELRKGVILTPGQVDDLAKGRKINWTPAQNILLRDFGNMSDTEKEVRRAEIRKDHSGGTREVLDNRPQLDCDRLWFSIHEEVKGICKSLGLHN